MLSAHNKIRICYISSGRELFSEGVGHIFKDEQDSLAALLNLQKNHPAIELSLIILDDDPKNLNRKILDRFLRSKVPLAFVPSSTWAKPISYYLKNYPGLSAAKEAKKLAKITYELKILDLLRKNDIDILISDSYIRLFGSTLLGSNNHSDSNNHYGSSSNNKNGNSKNKNSLLNFDYGGLIFNIHPADTSINPGISPTEDALFRQRLFFRINSKENFVLIDNKKYYKIELFENKKATFRENELEAARRIFGKYEGCFIENINQSWFLFVPRDCPRGIFSAKTGATLHFIDHGIDTGKKITFSNSTPVRKGDSAQGLRNRNYETKNIVLTRGVLMILKDKQVIQNILTNKIKNNFYKHLLAPSKIKL